MRNPSWDEILYCSRCGSNDVQAVAWVNANTDEYISDVNTPLNYNDCWCDCCESNTRLVTLLELWNEFSDDNYVFDRLGQISSRFLLFPAGTPKAIVLDWFKERMPTEIYLNATTLPKCHSDECN